ncbi:FeoB-associated Cys-rich membrane protein [uncultured Akkermansia sp.]|uniref:FeoB-associated Cys-rich membrane protein n=1 Tax=uncultured Akkermansia sp. TaxID=512294 RepID=UPI0026369CB2|nr:FeoB-associated Cys-rich membrane protein [uncultured Akkermansia sp.]
MGTYIIATLLFLALAYALYKILSKRGNCCGSCSSCGNDSGGCCGGNCCGGHHHDHGKRD